MADITNKWSGENPWLGLGSYSEGQKLYGRDREIEALTEIILNHPAIILYGKSGIGKSSLLKAGVFPQLRQNAMVPVYIRLVHNTETSYARQIENAISEMVNVRDMLPSTVPDLGLWDFMHRHQFTDSNGNSVTPVIVLDQFEEIFTLTDANHKGEALKLFTELADVLNNVKPDKVIQAEESHSKTIKAQIPTAQSTGFVIQAPSRKTTFNYNLSSSFRFVFSIRDDSLYLLERNCAKIPALKINRYNLIALDEANAMDVITKPASGLFSNEEAHEILDGLVDYEYDDFKVVDPAILSLFLFSYFREQGRVSYEDIFEQYYQENTHPKLIKESSVSFIEDNLLTERGNRNQVPLEDIYAAGVSVDEMQSLLDSKILKTEKRKGIDYVEFSHDRLCEQALKHRQERETKVQAKRMRKRLIHFALGGLTVLGILAAFTSQFIRYQWQEKQLLYSELEREKAENENIATKQTLGITEAERDSALKSNSFIKALYDSISNLNSSNHTQLILIKLQRDSLRATLAINNKQRTHIEHQRDSLILVARKNKMLTDSLKNVISIISAQKETIAEQSDSIQMIENKKRQLEDTITKIRIKQDLRTLNVNGIDVSRHQGKIDWECLSTECEKIKFVYCKATEGSNSVDPMYQINISNARKNGLKAGSFHFLSTKSSMINQVDNFIKTIDLNQQDLIPVVDIENTGKWTSQQFQDSVLLFLNLLERQIGVKPMIYTYENFYKKYFSSPLFSDYPIWIAKYSTNPPSIGRKWILWQFTEHAYLDCIGSYGVVDANRFNEKASLNNILYRLNE